MKPRYTSFVRWCHFRFMLCLNRNCCQFFVHCYSLTVSICHSFFFSRLCCVPLASSHKQIVSCLLWRFCIENRIIRRKQYNWRSRSWRRVFR
jgi:ABC-type uncharacterized transport system permease subunit